jgi:hypothetical protein
MHGDPENLRRDWRIPDTLWERIQPLLPPRKPHPLGCHRPRVEDRRAMDAIFFVLRTGCHYGTRYRTQASVPVVRAPPLPGMGGGRGLHGLLGAGPGCLRGLAGY